MPVSTIWALLFFLMMFILGISTMFCEFIIKIPSAMIKDQRLSPIERSKNIIIRKINNQISSPIERSKIKDHCSLCGRLRHLHHWREAVAGQVSMGHRLGCSRSLLRAQSTMLRIPGSENWFYLYLYQIIIIQGNLHLRDHSLDSITIIEKNENDCRTVTTSSTRSTSFSERCRCPVLSR